jgi:enoyl-CoA hydratase
MDRDTRDDLREAFRSAATEESVRSIVLRGAGEDAFIAGGDLDAFQEFDLSDGLEYTSRYAQGLYNEVATVPKPTIAAVDGDALGGGTEIALACDLRLATPNARFGLPEINLGILPAGGGTQRLVSEVGLGAAKEIIYTGNIIEAKEAERIGLVNHVYESNEFEAEVGSLAEEMATKPPIALRLAKESLNRAVDHEAGLDFERVAGALAFATEDRSEGVRAFLDGRDPEFEGE